MEMGIRRFDASRGVQPACTPLPSILPATSPVMAAGWARGQAMNKDSNDGFPEWGHDVILADVRAQTCGEMLPNPQCQAALDRTVRATNEQPAGFLIDRRAASL
jgi:hypothetical protein